MVIGPGRGAVTAFVILNDGEFIPARFNHPKIVVYRRGRSTNGELVEIKPLGELAKTEDLKPAERPACNYSGDGNPLHEHEDGTWWYFDEAWDLENGPFPTQQSAYTSLYAYCEDVQRTKELSEKFEEGFKFLGKFGLTKRPEKS